MKVLVFDFGKYLGIIHEAIRTDPQGTISYHFPYSTVVPLVLRLPLARRPKKRLPFD